MPKTRICSVEGCGKKHLAKGFCESHYQRNRNYGDPLLGGTSRGQPLRFLQQEVIPAAQDECFIWPYARDAAGYAQMQFEGRVQRVQRLVCTVRCGEPPSDKHEAAHLCGNGHLGCVNPAHIVWKTRQENQLDRILHGTTLRGERFGKSKLTEADVRAIRAMRGTKSQVEIAASYRVSKSTIWGILRGKNWAWLA